MMNLLEFSSSVKPSVDLELRDYQRRAVDDLRSGFRRGLRRQLLCSPTGSGKTFIAAWMAREAARKGKRVAFVVDRIALAEQTSASFEKFGIPHGVLQGQNSWGRGSHVMVCSAQTLEKRGFFPDLDLLFVDECHEVRKVTKEYLLTERERPFYAVGLTATPFTPGLGKIWQRCVSTKPTYDLVDEGWLAPLKVYRGAAADMTGAKKSAGEWASVEVARRGRVILGDIVENWVEKTAKELGGPAKTLVFSATVDHGEEVCAAFGQNGYDFRQISYRDSNDERRSNLIERYRRGEIMGLVSCEALAKGFDVPDTRVLISARNYSSSLARHIQQVGRVMRASPGKEFGLLLDHAGNWLRFRDEVEEFFTRAMKGRSLDMGKRKDRSKRPPRETRDELACAGCGLIIEPGCEECPGCGRDLRMRKPAVTVQDADLVLDTGRGKSPLLLKLTPEMREHVWGQVCRMALERKDDPESRMSAARSYYKTLTREWPRPYRKRFAPADYADEVIDHTLRRAWRRRSRG